MRRLLLCFIISIVLPVCCKAETFVVCVGISDYKYINDLKLPEADAKTIAEIYRTHTNCVTLLLGRQATKNAILDAVRSQFMKARKGDTILFSFSGHGDTGSLCPFDVTRAGQNLISFEEIQNIMKSSNASHKIIFADACHSGGLRASASPQQSSHQTSNEVILFLSSRSGEYSMEFPKWENGCFTAYLSKGLRGSADINRDRMITAKELFDYVNGNVVKATRGKQHPVMWGHFDDDYVILNWIKR